MEIVQYFLILVGVGTVTYLALCGIYRLIESRRSDDLPDYEMSTTEWRFKHSQLDYDGEVGTALRKLAELRDESDNINDYEWYDMLHTGVLRNLSMTDEARIALGEKPVFEVV